MNLETSQPSAPVTSDKEISTSHPVVGGSLSSSFPYVLIGPYDTTLAMSSSICTAMVTTTPPSSYPTSSNSILLVPANFGVSTGPSSSSLSGSSTTFHFGMGSSPIVGYIVSSTTTAITSTNTSIPGTFSLWSTPIVHNVPSASQSRAGLSSMGQASGIVLGSGFFPTTGNPNFSQNPNVGFPYGWNWTSSAPVGSQVTRSSYSGFGHNLGGFNPFGSPHIGSISGPFQPTHIG